MKFDLKDAPEEIPSTLIGNIYRCKGGNKTKYWVIVADTPGAVVCLGIDSDGNVTSSVNYGRHVFEGTPWAREPIGRAMDLSSLNFSIVWNK